MNFFGVTELLTMSRRPAELEGSAAGRLAAKLIGGPLLANPDKARSASPITYVTPDDPPVLAVHGNADTLVSYDQSVRLHEALRKAGVPSYLITVKGGGHGDFAGVADDRVKVFFAKYLRGAAIGVSSATVEWRRR